MNNAGNVNIPNNLISLAQSIAPMTAAVVCAHHKSAMESTKQAVEYRLIKPILIGNKKLICEEANKLDWDLNSVEIIDHNIKEEAAVAGAQLAKDNKIQIIIKGDLHTDILMKIYLKKEFGLIEGTRLSHIWHMTTPNHPKPIFITDGALNVAPRIDVKMHILRNVVEFAKKTGIYSAATPINLPHNYVSKLEITITTTSEITNLSFFYKVSSEEDEDRFEFLINGNYYGFSASGDVDWTEYSRNLQPGTHTLTWQYTKDESVSALYDAVFIDDVIR